MRYYSVQWRRNGLVQNISRLHWLVGELPKDVMNVQRQSESGGAEDITVWACVVCLDQTGIKYGDTVVVQDAGGLGLNATAYANERGAKTIVIEGIDQRIKQAKKFHADHIIDFREYETAKARAEWVRELTNSVGVAVAIEVAGIPEALNEGIELLRVGGRYLEMGNVRPGHTIAFDPGKLVRKSIDVITAIEYNLWVLYESLEFLANTKDTYPYEKHLDAEYALNKVEEALERSERRELTRATLVPHAR